MTMIWPAQDKNAMNAFYGNPDPNGDGHPCAIWEENNIVKIPPSFPMVLAWDINTPVKSIRIHKKCADSLSRILTVISTTVSQDDLEKYQINRYGGAYMFRMMRGIPQLSIHSWGAAIDLSPAINCLGKEYTSRPNMMPMRVVKAFEDEGWIWGGRFSRQDCMHAQAARI